MRKVGDTKSAKSKKVSRYTKGGCTRTKGTGRGK